MQTGIIGLPQVGKTTLFKILTRAQLDEKAARAATHVGVARVPEPRLDQLAQLYHPKKNHLRDGGIRRSGRDDQGPRERFHRAHAPA